MYLKEIGPYFLFPLQVALNRVQPTGGRHPAVGVEDGDGLRGEEQKVLCLFLVARNTTLEEEIGARVFKTPSVQRIQIHLLPGLPW